MDGYDDRGVTRVFTLRPPTGDVPLIHCHRDQRDLASIQVPPTDVSVDLTFETDDEGGVSVRCDNGILITPAQIVGYYVRSEEGRLSAFAEKKYHLDALDDIGGWKADFYKKMWATPGWDSGRVSLADLYNKGIEILDNPILKLVEPIFRTDPKHFDDYGQSHGKDQADDYQADITKPLSELSDEGYICLAALHLYFWFAKDSFVRVPMKTLCSPLAVQLFGQEFWWMLHLVSPHLNEKYTRLIVPMVRAVTPECSAFNHRTGEGFAIDFWQAWVSVVIEYDIAFKRWYQKLYDGPGSKKSLEAAAKRFKVAIDTITKEKEKEFISKYASYLIQEQMSINPGAHVGLSGSLGMSPLKLVFLAIAMDIHLFSAKK